MKGRGTPAALATALALAAAGCGWSHPGRSAQGDPVAAAVAFAGCMRSHGVPGWPDPSTSGAFDKSKLTTQLLGAVVSRVAAAQRACGHLLPNGGRPPDRARLQRVKAQGLAFARCVRAHGVQGFPDPGSDGRIPDPASVGIDQGSPRFEAANRECARYRPPYLPSNADYNAWARTHGGA